MLIDSHCHLDRLTYQNDANETGHPSVEHVLKEARQRGVEGMLCVSVTRAGFDGMHQLVQSHPMLLGSAGIHPLHLDDAEEQDWQDQSLIDLVSQDKIVAVGETGLDFHYAENQAKQMDGFRRHIRIARDADKPLIIHTRAARAETLDILREENAQQVGGVLHCFTEDLAMAKAAVDLGFYISISGIVTFRNASELRDVVRALPLESLLVETDAPYLAPVPYRGKENQPAYVRAVAEYVAELKGVPVAELIAQTGENFFNCFPLARQYWQTGDQA